jgi:hypothetical protein
MEKEELEDVGVDALGETTLWQDTVMMSLPRYETLNVPGFLAEGSWKTVDMCGSGWVVKARFVADGTETMDTMYVVS